jgi:aspartyl-tRNA synthetase
MNDKLTNSVQMVSSTDDPKNALHKRLKKCKFNTPVVVRGSLKLGPEGTSRVKDGLQRSKYEFTIKSLQVLNDFPQEIDVSSVFPPSQRHLQLKHEPRLREALRFRSKVTETCRSILRTRDFTEVETPQLFKSTPEGAREFLVPTRQKGTAYALPQSPQQFKQILMASNIPRYYQFARCFRDEDLRADRQPEFTQVSLIYTLETT